MRIKELGLIVGLVFHKLEGVDLTLACAGTHLQTVLVAVVLCEEEVRVILLELILACLWNSHHPFQVFGDVAVAGVKLILIVVQRHRRSLGRTSLLRVVGHSHTICRVNNDNRVTNFECGGINFHPLHLYFCPHICSSNEESEQQQYSF